MSRKQSRARKHRAWLEHLRVAVEAARAEGPGALEKLFQLLAASDKPVWDVTRVVALDEDERVRLAQIVAPHLAGMTPASVARREKYGRDS